MFVGGNGGLVLNSCLCPGFGYHSIDMNSIYPLLLDGGNVTHNIRILALSVGLPSVQPYLSHQHESASQILN